jgi:nucleoside-diphosphate-sugar epimerase
MLANFADPRRYSIDQGIEGIDNCGEGRVNSKDGTTQTQARSLVLGATGVVGGYIVDRLVGAGERPIALSRSPQSTPGIDWVVGDLEQADILRFPSFATLYCTADAILLPAALPYLFNASFKRAVVFSSNSVITKLQSEIVAEREMRNNLATAEQKIIAACAQNNVAWTILRPTLIYAEGRDVNITPLSRLIRRFGFMPLVGGAPGLRQPVHAEDLAIGAIAAASSPTAANKIYLLPGGETLAYREMIGRIFDGLRLPRRTLSVPAWVWRTAFVLAKPLFPDANVAMGIRMMKDMTFDPNPAIQDFGWNPRSFHPVFAPF